jgi:hypothetical protein
LGTINGVVRLENAKPELFIIKDNKFENVKTATENKYDYEIMIYLVEGFTADSAITRITDYIFGLNIKPIIIYEFGSTSPKIFFNLPESYASLKVNSNTGKLSCI